MHLVPGNQFLDHTTRLLQQREEQLGGRVTVVRTECADTVVQLGVGASVRRAQDGVGMAAASHIALQHHIHCLRPFYLQRANYRDHVIDTRTPLTPVGWGTPQAANTARAPLLDPNRCARSGRTPYIGMPTAAATW